MEIPIEIENLTKKFGSITAVKNATLKVEPGSIHGFLGPNGAGKSTTIKILLGLLKADEGKAKIFGKNALDGSPEIRQNVGYMPELPKFPKHLTGEELLELYGQMYGVPKDEIKKDIPHLIELVGLSGREQNKIGEYSKGMQQRLGIAQAMINDPELLILDEPSIGLDPVGMVEIRNLLKSIAKEGRTIFLSSHLLNEVQQICTHITIINKGSIQASGSLSDLRNGLSLEPSIILEVLNLNDNIVEAVKTIPNVKDTVVDGQRLRVNLNTREDVRSLVSQKITSMGGVIIEMNQTIETLEDVFLKLVTKPER
ncbi:ABC transporter ATP-binding protein [Candidatus Bathyarchaeota archaeon]|nr:ABC transporter ATP-binding protein [Candidatus Bathyarchaeota archaeon]